MRAADGHRDISLNFFSKENPKSQYYIQTAKDKVYIILREKTKQKQKKLDFFFFSLLLLLLYRTKKKGRNKRKCGGVKRESQERGILYIDGLFIKAAAENTRQDMRLRQHNSFMMYTR